MKNYVEEQLYRNAQGRFQETGVRKQLQATNMSEALRNYNDSCMRCTMSGRRCNGTACAITKALAYNAEQKQNELWDNPSLRKELEYALEMG